MHFLSLVMRIPLRAGSLWTGLRQWPLWLQREMHPSAAEKLMLGQRRTVQLMSQGCLGPWWGVMEPQCMRWELPDVNGSYVFGKRQGLEVTYTVDNGTSDTIVNPRVYKRIPEDVQPQLFQASWWVKGAGGEPIKIWQQTPFDLQLGPVSLQRVLMVAEIEDQVLLGDDILRRDPEGPMDILNTEKVMVFKGLQIPLHMVEEQK